MSAQTLAAVEAAIAAHIADEFPGQMLAHHATVVHMVRIEDDVAGYDIVTPDPQAFHVDEGLLRVGLRILGDTWKYGRDEAPPA